MAGSGGTEDATDGDTGPTAEGSEPPERPGGVAAMVRALDVPRNATVGAGVAVAVTVLVYAVRVFELLGPAPQGAAGPGLFLTLAFVLAFGTFVLVTFGLTVRSLYGLLTAPEDGESDAAGGRSPVTLGALGAFLGYLLLETARGSVVAPRAPGFDASLQMVTTTLFGAAVGLIALRVAGAFSIQERWAPRVVLGGGLALSAGLAALSLLGTGGLTDLTAVSTGAPVTPPALLTLALALVVGLAVGLAGSLPPHGFLVGVVGGVAAIPMVAVGPATPATLVLAGYVLPVALGVAGGVGGVLALGVRRARGSGDISATG